MVLFVAQQTRQHRNQILKLNLCHQTLGTIFVKWEYIVNVAVNTSVN